MTKPRVLFLVHNHPSIRPGGAEEYAVELHEALLEGDEFDPVLVARGGQRRDARPVLTPVPQRPQQYLLATQGEEYDHLQGSFRRRSFYTEDLARVVAGIHPDIVHIQHTWQVGYPAIRAIRKVVPNAPIVYTLHEYMAICHRGGQMVRVRDDSRCLDPSPQRCHECFPAISAGAFFQRERLIRSHLDLVDLFIAPSAFLRDRYVDWGIPPDRIMVEEYGRREPSAVARAADHPTPDRFAFFGQLTPFKGVDVLLEAMVLLLRRGGGSGPSPQLAVHGANLELQPSSFRQRFSALADAAADAVSMRGPYDHEQLPGLMEETDWVVVPSIWWENSPLVIQEAFAHGRPVICSDIGGMAEKVAPGRSGLYFRAGDAASLADVMERAVTEPGLWDLLRQGIPRVHSMQHHVETVSELYRSLLAHRQPTPAR